MGLLSGGRSAAVIRQPENPGGDMQEVPYYEPGYVLTGTQVTPVGHDPATASALALSRTARASSNEHGRWRPTATRISDVISHAGIARHPRRRGVAEWNRS